MAVKTGFKLDWYFLIVNKKWEQSSCRKERKKRLSSQTFALKNTDKWVRPLAKFICWKTWVTWEGHKIKKEKEGERQRDCEVRRTSTSPKCDTCFPTTKTHMKYPPTWIGAGNNPCSCSPGVYSSFSFFNCMRRLFGLWMTATQKKKKNQNEECLSFARNTFSLLIKAQMSRTSGKRIIIETAKKIDFQVPCQIHLSHPFQNSWFDFSP